MTQPGWLERRGRGCAGNERGALHTARARLQPPHAGPARSAASSPSAPVLRQPDPPPPSGPQRQGAAGPAWRAAGRRARSAGSWCAGEWAPRGWPGGEERGVGSNLLPKRRGCWLPDRNPLRPCAPAPLRRTLRLSAERSAGTRDPVYDSRLWKDPGLLPQAHRRGSPRLTAPQLSRVCNVEWRSSG